MKRVLSALLVGLAIGALGWAFLAPEKAPETVYKEVIVEDTTLLRAEPDTIVKWREKIVWKEHPPARIATAEGADRVLRGFCEPIIRKSVADSVFPQGQRDPLVSPRWLMRSLSYDDEAFQLQVWGIANDATFKEINVNDVRGSFRVRVQPDGDLFVQSERFDRWKDYAFYTALVSAGFAIGSIIQ